MLLLGLVIILTSTVNYNEARHATIGGKSKDESRFGARECLRAPIGTGPPGVRLRLYTGFWTIFSALGSTFWELLRTLMHILQ